MLGKMAQGFSNVWKIRPRFFQSLENTVSLRSLIFTPAMFQAPFPPCSSKAITSNTAPEAAGQFAASVRLRCKRHGHLPFRRQEPAGRSSRSRARHRSGWRRLAVTGVATLRGPASPGSLRAHPSRHGATPCHAGCFALRSRDAVETCPQAPERKWGACEHVSFPFGPVLSGFRWLPWTAFATVCRVFNPCTGRPRRGVTNGNDDATRALVVG